MNHKSFINFLSTVIILLMSISIIGCKTQETMPETVISAEEVKKDLEVRSAKIPVLNITGMYNDLIDRELDENTYIDWASLIKHIKEQGFNDITLIVSGGTLSRYNDNYFDVKDPYNPPIDIIERLVTLIHDNGLTVTLSPFYHVDGGVISGDPSLAGMDRPMPQDRNIFMKSLSEKIEKWSSFAEQNKIERFIVFTDEIQHLTLDPNLTGAWLKILDKLKLSYSGVVSSGFTYQIGFKIPSAILSKLDVLGLGFFPELSEMAIPDIETLRRAYYFDLNQSNPIERLTYLSKIYNKPIWITDKAFHSFEGAGHNIDIVFNEEIPLKANAEVQRNLYESFFSVIMQYKDHWLYGISFQNYNNVIGGTIRLPRYMNGPLSESPQRKQAEDVIRYWFAGDYLEEDIFAYEEPELELSTQANISVAGIKVAGVNPIISISQKGKYLTWREIKNTERIDIKVDKTQPLIISVENWDFIDFSNSGNRYITINEIYINGKLLDLSKHIKYIAQENYQSEFVGIGKTSSVHGGYFIIHMLD